MECLIRLLESEIEIRDKINTESLVSDLCNREFHAKMLSSNPL